MHDAWASKALVVVKSEGLRPRFIGYPQSKMMGFVR